MTSTNVNRTLPLATILVALTMFLGSVPSVDIAAMTSYSDTEKVQTETFYFDETILHASEKTGDASDKTSVPNAMPRL